MKILFQTEEMKDCGEGEENDVQEMKPVSGMIKLQKMKLVYNKIFTEYQLRAFGEDGAVYYSPISFINP